MSLILAGIGLGLSALGTGASFIGRRQQARQGRALAGRSSAEYLRQAGLSRNVTSRRRRRIGGFSESISYEETGGGILGQMKRQGREFLGRASVSAGLSGAAGGGSIGLSLQESERRISQEQSEFVETAVEQSELIRAGGEAQASALSPGFGDALSFAGGLFSGAYNLGRLTGLPRQPLGGFSPVGTTSQAIPGSNMWGL